MFKLAKVETVRGQVGDARGLDELLVFDARMLDVTTRQKLLLLMPQLVHVRRAWKVIFLRRGCIACHRKKVQYGAGGFCNRCQCRILLEVKSALRRMDEGRDSAEETAALTRRLDVAQFLLGERTFGE